MADTDMLPVLLRAWTAIAEGPPNERWHLADRRVGHEVHRGERDDNGGCWTIGAKCRELNDGYRETFTKEDANHIARFDPPTVKALLAALTAAHELVDALTNWDDAGGEPLRVPVNPRCIPVVKLREALACLLTEVRAGEVPEAP